MFSSFSENQTITETLRGHIDRKLSSLGSPEFAYTVIRKKIRQMYLLFPAILKNG